MPTHANKRSGRRATRAAQRPLETVSIHHPCGVTRPAAGRGRGRWRWDGSITRTKSKPDSVQQHCSLRTVDTSQMLLPPGSLVSPLRLVKNSRMEQGLAPCRNGWHARNGKLPACPRQSLRRLDSVGNKTQQHMKMMCCSKCKTICPPTRRAPIIVHSHRQHEWADHPKQETSA